MTVEAKDYFFGAPASVTYDNIDLGITTVEPKVTAEYTYYTPPFIGVAGEVKGMRQMTKAKITGATTLEALSAARLQRALLNSTTTVGTAAVTSPSGLATTLTADVAAGASSITLTAATNIADDVFLKIGDAGETEIVKVGTYVSGLTVTLTTPLVRSHDSGDAVVMVDDAGTTIIRQRIGRVPDEAYGDLVIQGIGLDGEALVITLFDAINEANAEFTFGETTTTGVPLSFIATVDVTDPTLIPWAIER
jgi:hypothetical protein